MNKTESTCTRVCANVNQINACMKLLNETNESISNLSEVLCLAGNETRLRILYLIYKEKEMCVCDMSDILEMSVSAISQHLRKMKDGNVLLDRKEGQTIFYYINEDYLEIILPIFIQISKNKIEEKVL